MAKIYHDKLVELIKYPKRVRNVCILAHVDHGKTTIADSLLSTNAIINKRLAGQLRYLDDRSDEQRRGITMKSSSVALYFKSKEDEQEYLINLIDSPGHVDFSLEVVSAARLSDGAFIVIDVVEGICSQTISAIEEAFLEKARMILVLNKIDRLILEKKMNIFEIYDYLSKIVESVNAVVAEIRIRDYTLKIEDTNYVSEHMDDEFEPSSRNVLFASAIDGWAFRLYDFAVMYSKHFDLPAEEIEENLFKDCFFDKRKGVIVQGAKQRNKNPLFVSMVLNNIYALYNDIIMNRDTSKISKIFERLELKATNKDFNSSVPRTQLRAIMSEWLPLSKAFMESVVKVVPSPCDLTNEKIARLIRSDVRFGEDEIKLNSMESYIKSCSGDKDIPLLGYVSKVFPIDRSQLVKNKFNVKFETFDLDAKKAAVKQRRLEMEKMKDQNPEGECVEELIECSDNFKTLVFTNEKVPNKKVIVGLVRVFSGVLEKGTELNILTPSSKLEHFTTSNTEPENKLNMQKIQIGNIYLPVGRELIPVDSAVAGNIVAVGDLSSYMIRTGTLASTSDFLPLLEVGPPSEPFYRTAIEPEYLTDMSELLNAVKALMQIDNCVQCVLQENGQYILLTAGDVHLQKCLEDLNSITSVPFLISDPMVKLRETILPVSTCQLHDEIYLSPVLEEMGLELVIKACHVPDSIVKIINKNFSLLKSIELTDEFSTDVPEFLKTDFSEMGQALEPYKHAGQKSFKNTFTASAAEKIRTQLSEAFGKLSDEWKNATECIMSVGNQQADCCMLLNFSKNYQGRSIWNKMNSNDIRCYYDNCVINGFQLAIQAGPVCDEPMINVMFCILELNVDLGKIKNFGNIISGTVFKEVKNICHNTFNCMQPRLMEPVFSTNMHVESSSLGKVHKTLFRRNGRVTSSNQIASNVFQLEAILPILESQDFCNEIRMETSGTVNPILQFGGYNMLPYSPFTPIIGDLDETYIENRAYKLMNNVRRRKGLSVDEQIVSFAEKQRTINKKK